MASLLGTQVHLVPTLGPRVVLCPNFCVFRLGEVACARCGTITFALFVCSHLFVVMYRDVHFPLFGANDINTQVSGHIQWPHILE